MLQEEFGPRVLLFGADYVWPRRSFEIAKPIIEENGGEVVGEIYLPLVAEDFTELVSAVRDTQPDYMFSLYPAAFAPALQALNDAGTARGPRPGQHFRRRPRPARRDRPRGQGMYTTLPYFTAIDTPECTFPRGLPGRVWRGCDPFGR